MKYFENDRKIYLLANNKEHQVDMKVTYDCKENEGESVIISVVYEGQIYSGYGHEYLGLEAFADLQKQLPQGVIMKCCLSCKHGNQCPVGNSPNELFCTRDVEIKQIKDLWLYTEDETERQKRLRSYASACAEWQEQSEEYYTYNDFYYLMQIVRRK